MLLCVLMLAGHALAFRYVGQYSGNPAQKPYESNVTSGLLYAAPVGGATRQFVAVAYLNGRKLELTPNSLAALSPSYALLAFTGYDRTPDAMLGDTSGDTDGAGELSNTQPLYRELSMGNHTVRAADAATCA